MRVLVTGGAGFIGSHVVDRLLSEGHEVTILDALIPQVHGPTRNWPEWTRAQFKNRTLRAIFGDIRDAATVRTALEGVGAVVHLAAEVGVGQGQYEIARYVDTNTRGTAIVLEEAIRAEVPRILVAGSMSAYGEGLYECEEHGALMGSLRPREQLTGRRWRMECPICSLPMDPLPVPETQALRPAGIYAQTKRDTEDLALQVGAAYGVSVGVTRFFNVYGPRQALGNPYTGVAAIFAGAMRRGKAPMIFEDGLQARDFVHVLDVARAVVRILFHGEAGGVFNVATGKPTSILSVYERIAETLGFDYPPRVPGEFRMGDIRTCIGDASKLRALGWDPTIGVQEGLAGVATWALAQEVDRSVPDALMELRTRGLVK